jgi:hypothetical protein
VIEEAIVKKLSTIVLSGGLSPCRTRSLVFEDNCQHKCAPKAYRRLGLTTSSSAFRRILFKYRSADRSKRIARNIQVFRLVVKWKYQIFDANLGGCERT